MFQFHTTCVSANGNDITVMVDNSTEITRRTFLKYIDRENFRECEKSLGYVSRGGLAMANDHAVSYYKSHYRGRKCVYFYWSAIEYIFI